MCKVRDPIIIAVIAFINNVDQGPIKSVVTKKSDITGLYTVINSIPITIGTKLCFKSCLDQSQTNVAVVIC